MGVPRGEWGAPQDRRAPRAGGAASCAVAPGLSILGSGGPGEAVRQAPSRSDDGASHAGGRRQEVREGGGPAAQPGAGSPRGPGRRGRGAASHCVSLAGSCAMTISLTLRTTSTRSLSLWSRELQEVDEHATPRLGERLVPRGSESTGVGISQTEKRFCFLFYDFLKSSS